jgi:hypothetical protein
VWKVEGLPSGWSQGNDSKYQKMVFFSYSFSMVKYVRNQLLPLLEEGRHTQPPSYLSGHCSSSVSPPPLLSLCSPPHCTENPIYVFPEMKLPGLVPNSYIHVSVSNLYIPRVSLPICPSKIGSNCENTVYKSLTDT